MERWRPEGESDRQCDRFSWTIGLGWSGALCSALRVKPPHRCIRLQRFAEA